MLKSTETYAKMFLASVSFRFRPVFKKKKIVIPLAITSHIPLWGGRWQGIEKVAGGWRRWQGRPIALENRDVM